jgi:predicted nucleotidyltransferase
MLDTAKRKGFTAASVTEGGYDWGASSSEIKEMTMLELSAVDLDALSQALEDHSDFVSWFVDPASGEVVPWSADMDLPDPEDRGACYVEPLPSWEAYEDLQDFVARVPERRAAELLARAIEGRGAFRRFKDTLFEFPAVREAWFAFHDVRMRRRAVEWLRDAGLVEEASADAAIAGLQDPAVGDGVVDPWALAAQVAKELRGLFGDRLVDVVVFGSYATDTATDDSDLDVAVVLRGVDSPWEESRRMDEILWRHTLAAGITISALVVDSSEWDRAGRPLLRTAKASGRSVT